MGRKIVYHTDKTQKNQKERMTAMNKMETYDLLRSRNIWLEITEHKAVYNMAELADVELPYPSADAKNLFVRDDKKRNYYLITVQGDKRVNLKEFKKQHGTRSLSFASADDLLALLGLEPGSVTPWACSTTPNTRCQSHLDRSLLADPGLIGVHPRTITATVWMKTQDLIDRSGTTGTQVHVVPVEEKG